MKEVPGEIKIEIGGFINGDDPRPVEVISASDRPHRFTLSGIYEFPFGKGRKFFANAGRTASLFVGGWQISTVYQFQSSVPLGFGNVIYNGDVKDLLLSGDEQAVDRWFNNSGFVALRERLPDGTFRIVRNANNTPVLVD